MPENQSLATDTVMYLLCATTLFVLPSSPSTLFPDRPFDTLLMRINNFVTLNIVDFFVGVYLLSNLVIRNKSFHVYQTGPREKKLRQMMGVRFHET